MSNIRRQSIFCVVGCVLIGVLAGAAVVSHARPRPPQTPTSANENTVWDLEHTYWRYVEANDLVAYRTLWNENFLGWPWISAAPVGKHHITDWITSHTSKGLTFKLLEFKPAAIQATGEGVVVTCYWETDKWADQNGAGEVHTSRIFHTWIKTGNDWQIIGGMSASENK